MVNRVWSPGLEVRARLGGGAAPEWRIESCTFDYNQGGEYSKTGIAERIEAHKPHNSILRPGIWLRKRVTC